MTLAEIIASVKAEGGFDVTDAVVTGWINAAYRDLVVRSRFRLAEASLGNTVAGTFAYAFSATYDDLDTLQVGTGRGSMYERSGERDMMRLRAGDLVLRGVGGRFGPYHDATAAAMVQLFPTPDTSGLAIVALVAQQPVDLAAGGDVPIVPVDFHDKIRDKAVGTGLKLVDERIAEGQSYDVAFDGHVELLRKRKNSRIGSGPSQMAVQGYHF